MIFILLINLKVSTVRKLHVDIPKFSFKVLRGEPLIDWQMVIFPISSSLKQSDKTRTQFPYFMINIVELHELNSQHEMSILNIQALALVSVRNMLV